MDYLELKVDVSPRTPWAEILVAELAEVGFESFVDTETGILAYAPADDIDLKSLVLVSILNMPSDEVDLQYSTTIIEQQNWNAVWEADFQPVFVEEYATILAPFHDVTLAKGMKVEIQPQMSFGTGHHQTTWMMSKALFEETKMPATVLDMGTGTGVLAIIAEKLGAKDVLAIDIEDWSVENTKENAVRNQCTAITALHGDIDLIEGKSFELILANINKNILKAQLPSYATALVQDGILYMSGFFETDTDELIEVAEKLGLKYDKTITKETWAALRFVK